MGYGIELKGGSGQHQTSKLVDEKFCSTKSNRILRFHDKLKEAPFAQSFIDLNLEPKQDVDVRRFIKPTAKGTPLKQWPVRKVATDDELVKHMSNVPSYLQRMDRGENKQPLNFGVLDWDRLEKWKSSQKGVKERGCAKGKSTCSNPTLVAASGSATNSIVGRDETPNPRKKLQPVGLHSNSACSGGLPQGVKLSRGKVTRIQDVETASKSALHGRKKLVWKDQSLGKSISETVLQEGKNNDVKPKQIPVIGSAVANLRDSGVSLTSKQNVSTLDGDKRIRREDLRDLTADLAYQHFPSQPEQIVLILPKDVAYARNLSEDNYAAERTSGIPHSCPLPNRCNPNVKSDLPSHARENSECKELQYDESRRPQCPESATSMLVHDQHAEEGPSQVKHESSNVTDSSLTWSRGSPEAPRERSFWGRDLLCDESHKLWLPNRATPIIVHDQHAEERASRMKHRSSNVTESSTRLNQGNPAALRGRSWEGRDLLCNESCKPQRSNRATTKLLYDQHAEERTSVMTHRRSNATESSMRLNKGCPEAPRGRSLSPNRMFSFGFSRMSRSSSFKEHGAVPQLSSTYVSFKSGPVASGTSSFADKTVSDNACMNNRSRSSPLRRLLDPFLKPKATNLSHAETGQGSSLISGCLRPFDSGESMEEGKHETLTVQALLQLTIKNGLPLFQFVVDNNNDILAATSKGSSTFEKRSSRLDYTFYSVCEIKKKRGSWISQGSKEKSYGYVYNVIGHMKVSNSCWKGQGSRDRFSVRESVLFGVDLKGTDKDAPGFISRAELAAIIMKIPKESSECSPESSECSPKYEFSRNGEENKVFPSTLVILPDGVHGLPHKGAPSPLINRWKTGGSCDCGGWDVGCKLRLLSNNDRCSSMAWPNKGCNSSSNFNLFVQGGGKQRKPILSVAPYERGIFSVKFNRSISLLQAFSICVATMGGLKSPDLLEAENMLEARPLHGINCRDYDRLRASRFVQGRETANAKHVPNPPLSPVGRV
ncbi:Protein of unknown function DUF3527 [Dillenia turbinata]|uniref:Uncharacterized protein n=1 Tax=Dillenia turbinata TaxID=194707 RepID=A0AAN8ZJ11_9MAGN